MKYYSKELENAGLSSNEARVYLASLELGETSAARISKKSGVKRSTVYLAIENLKQKNLISGFRKGGRTVFFAESPKKLESNAKQAVLTLENIMPELLAITNALDVKPSVRYFEGRGGLKELFNDILKYPKGEVLEWYSESFISEFDEEFFSGYFTKERVKKEVRARAIIPDSPSMRSLSEKNQLQLRRTKLISPDEYNMRAEINVYGQKKVSIIAFKEEVGLIIESPLIYESMKTIFELVWKYVPGKEA